nr:unnamed protein product [Callosobruchus analis]
MIINYEDKKGLARRTRGINQSREILPGGLQSSFLEDPPGCFMASRVIWNKCRISHGGVLTTKKIVVDAFSLKEDMSNLFDKRSKNVQPPNITCKAHAGECVRYFDLKIYISYRNKFATGRHRSYRFDLLCIVYLFKKTIPSYYSIRQNVLRK